MTPTAEARAAFLEGTKELSRELGQYRREIGDHFYFPAVTDRDEAEWEHRVDWIADMAYCTCRGFIHHRHCKHADRVKEIMDMETSESRPESMALDKANFQLPAVHRSPQQLANRLADMVQERGLVAAFFKDVMEIGHDYGIIPGTDKPTLFKPGAEKLCELYGYAPVVRDRQETVDYETGFMRVVITMGLVSKDSGTMVAEGVGECNTREARYFYRWVGENKVPEGMDKKSLKSDKRNGKYGEYIVYRLENDDLFTLWNTVLKMAKKRALVDVTLSATRSSGIFGRSAAEVQEWIEAEYTDITDLDDEPDEAPPPKSQRTQARARPARQQESPAAEGRTSGAAVTHGAEPSQPAPGGNEGSGGQSSPATDAAAAAPDLSAMWAQLLKWKVRPPDVAGLLGCEEHELANHITTQAEADRIIEALRPKTEQPAMV